MKNQSVRICPECNSTDISYDLSNPALVAAGMTNNAFVCNNCGNRGIFFPEVEKDKVPKIKKPKKKSLINTQYYSNINWLWKITGPLLLVIGIVLCFFGMPFIIFALLDIIPLAIVITLNAYIERLRKNKIFRIIFIVIFLYAITIGPSLALYVSDLLK